jgi:Na+/melibiose symporter-like transporter
MSALDEAGVWRSRAQAFAVAGVLCFVCVGLLKSFGSAEVAGNLIFLLVVLSVLFWLAGLYCTHRYWKEFCDDEIRRGGSTQTAREKWRLLHPPMS